MTRISDPPIVNRWVLHPCRRNHQDIFASTVNGAAVRPDEEHERRTSATRNPLSRSGAGIQSVRQPLGIELWRMDPNPNQTWNTSPTVLTPVAGLSLHRD